MNEITIKLRDRFGTTSLGPRFWGVELRKEILITLNDVDAVAVFDFEGIEYVSSGFAKELFGELFRELKGAFRNRTRIKIPPTDKFIRSSIVRGIASVAGSQENTIHDRQKTPA